MRAQRVTAAFFTVLRQQPVIGRAFTADNENDGQHQVAVLSDGLWRRRFGADPAIVGKTIPLEGGAYAVLGVMAPEFDTLRHRRARPSCSCRTSCRRTSACAIRTA